jgi:hypothetical protein
MNTLKKTLTILIPWLVYLAIVYPAFPALARGFHHRPSPVPPPPAPAPAPVPPPPVETSTIPWGAYNGNTNSSLLGSVKGVFIGDGDSFTEDFGKLKVPLVVYWESSFTAAQISAGKADSFLKTWSAEMQSYGQPIKFAPLDEMNGNRNPYFGNPAAYKAAWIRVKGFFSAPNVTFFYDPNNDPSNQIASYYPGSQYVDGCALDGFGSNQETWTQTFVGDGSLAAIKALCPGKPIWILSTGTTANESQFISDSFNGAKTYGLSGLVFYDADQYVLTASALSTLSTLKAF